MYAHAELYRNPVRRSDVSTGFYRPVPGVGAENSCHLGGYSAGRSPASGAGGADLGLSGRAMIFGLWA
jgi:hypothetical protein